MLKTYLKHNKQFRMLFDVPLKMRRRYLNSSVATADKRYRTTVIGGHIIISPQNIGGRFKISATSDLAKRIIMMGDFETELTRVLSNLVGLRGDIINVGANVGFYPVYFAKKFPNIRKIYAIEPNPEAYANLEWNINENRCSDRVETLQICISDEEDESQFALIPGMPEYSSINQIVHSAVSEYRQKQISIKVVPLDHALPNSIDPALILVDTEGAELLVFRGAERILKKSTPVVFFECDNTLLQKFHHSSEMLEAYLKDIGYAVRNAYDPRLSLKHPFIGEAVAFSSTKSEWVLRLLGKR